jgi:predicted RNA-binding protein with PIN domain
MKCCGGVSAAFQKHLLVDGSNVMHAWPELRALLKRHRDLARGKLSQAVSVLHDVEQVRVTLVFDGRGREISVEQPSGHATFALIHTPSGTTADDVIERLVGQAREPGRCLVATDDRAERQVIESLGAAGLSAADLATWIERTGQRQVARLAERRHANEEKWRRRD